MVHSCISFLALANCLKMDKLCCFF